MTRKIGYGILNEIKELELDSMKHDYMRTKCHKRGHGTSRNLKVVFKSHLMLFDMVKIVKGNFMSLGPFYFHILSLKLIHGQNNNTKYYSLCTL